MPRARPAKAASGVRTDRARVLVVGDVMLDRYWFGDVSRISPEAPVPVVLFRNEEQRAGGAANVALNCAALGAQAHILSVVGDDAEGAALRGILESSGVKVGFHTDASVRTTQKLRVLSRQQLLRIDFETAPSREVLSSKLAEFRKALGWCNVVILSDYGKGGLSHIGQMIRLARAAGRPVLVDPKGDDYSRYRGADLITPNLNELRQVIGVWRNEDELARRAGQLRAKLRLRGLLLTRGGDGMTLFRAVRAPMHVTAEQREVYDVSGAGDTVIATLATMLAARVPLEQAVKLANRAGGISVTKLGTAVVTRKELLGN